MFRQLYKRETFFPLFSAREMKSKEHWTNVLRRQNTAVLVPHLSSYAHSVTWRGARCGDTQQQSPGAAHSPTQTLMYDPQSRYQPQFTNSGATDILWDVQRKYTPKNWISELCTNERALIWPQQEIFKITCFLKHMLFIKYVLRSSRQVLDYWTSLLIKDSCFRHFSPWEAPVYFTSGGQVSCSIFKFVNSLLSSVTPPQDWSSQVHRNWRPLLKAKLTVSFFSKIPCGNS